MNISGKNQTTIKAKVRWLNFEEGGRKKPPCLILLHFSILADRILPHEEVKERMAQWAKSLGH